MVNRGLLPLTGDRYEDSTVVEAALRVDSHIIPAASCDIGAAAVPEMQPLLPATYIAHGVQGSVISEGSESYEDPPVLEVDPHNLPPAPCEFGAAVADLQAEVGELVAVQTISDCFDETSTVERTAAVLEVEPLLPRCDIGATDLQAMIMADPCIVDEQVVGELLLFEPVSFFMLQLIMDKIFNDYIIAAGKLFGVLFFSLKNSSTEHASSFEEFSGVYSPKQLHKWRDKTDEQGLMEDDSGSGVGLLGVEMQDVDCMSGIRAYIDGVHGAVIIDRAECYEFSPVVEAELEENFHNIEQVFTVVNSPKKHHKWREKSDVQGLFCCSNGLGSFGFDEDPSGECKETAAVLPFSDTGAANCGESAAAKLQGMADPCMIDVQASSGVNSSKKHHLWCEILDEQGLFSFEELDMLQILARLVWNLAATNHDQLIFKIQHKWRDKGMLICIGLY